MRAGFSPLAGVVPILVFAGRSVLADVAPPPTVTVPPSAEEATQWGMALIGFGVLAASVAVVSILVIRAVRQNRDPELNS